MKRKLSQKKLRSGSVCLLGLCLLGGMVFPAGGCGRPPAVDNSPLPVSDHIAKARLFYHLGNHTGAVEMYHKALEMDPDNPDAYLQLGIIYDDNLKDKGRAADYYREFLKREPDSEKADRVRGWLEKSENAAGGRVSAAAPAADPPPPRVLRVPERVLSPPPAVPALPTPLPVRPVISAARPDNYTVRAGDTLAGIARSVYGDPNAWNRIYQANRETMAGPNALKVGQVLTIPR